MNYTYKNEHTDAFFSIQTCLEKRFKGIENRYVILWNWADTLKVTCDLVLYEVPPQSLFCLAPNQVATWEPKEDVVIISFNRPFYCVVEHDEEISCVGLLFFNAQQRSIQLPEKEQLKLESLLETFFEEFKVADKTQEEMLRMLLTRWIILCTRLYKDQEMTPNAKKEEVDLVRQFHYLVEQNFKKHHKVQEYAQLLFKSPKTLSNLFKKYGEQTPLSIIQHRIILEAKRLLLYTDYSIKEVALHLGFEEVSNFNRLFKKITKMAPSAFKKTHASEVSISNPNA